MKTIFSALDKRSARSVWRLSLLFSLTIIAIAIVSAKFSHVEPFLVLPIVFASWYGSSKAGVLLALVTSSVLAVSRVWFGDSGYSLESIVYDGLSHMLRL